MAYVDSLFKNELGHQISVSLGSCHVKGLEAKSVLLEIAGDKDRRIVTVLTRMELEELIKVGQAYQKKLAREAA